MTNETKIECYFRSADLAELCKNCDDIVIHFIAAYPPDKPPKFDISAKKYFRSKEGGVVAKSLVTAPTASPDELSGCPYPCHPNG
jgi:hypothetical protein